MDDDCAGSCLSLVSANGMAAPARPAITIDSTIEMPMIALTKLRQDPAQSSSIVLTTVTDVAGFFSFLGIATLLLQSM